jgi:hypothetical protein
VRADVQLDHSARPLSQQRTGRRQWHLHRHPTLTPYVTAPR